MPAAIAIAASRRSAQDRPAAPTPPDPLDAQAAVPPLVHQSALAAYRRLADVEPVPWRVANETVGRIGGWRAYAREAAEPSAPVQAAPAAAAAIRSRPGRVGSRVVEARRPSRPDAALRRDDESQDRPTTGAMAPRRRPGRSGRAGRLRVVQRRRRLRHRRADREGAAGPGRAMGALRRRPRRRRRSVSANCSPGR